MFFYLLLSFCLLILPSCGYKNYTRQEFTSARNISLAIDVPDNKLVFENLSSIVYSSVWSHFRRVGYKLVDKKNCSYYLKILVKKLDSPYKFLSPDLLTYSIKMKVDLLCQLFDNKNILIAKKVFSLSTLIPKSKSYVENSKFSDFEYKRLFNKYAYKIDNYFRPYFLKLRVPAE